MIRENYLTIDVEDYFQVSAFEPLVAKSEWDNHASRVCQNTRKILTILEENNTKATFFVLGWTAEKHPEIVREIASFGHEVGCHSFYHRLVYSLTPEQFYDDTKKAKDTLEQIIGRQVLGYRAPSYSITKDSLWALEILKELGFTYDSSIFPIHHDRYGIPGAPRNPFAWDISTSPPKLIPLPAETIHFGNTTNLIEFPISTVKVMGKNLPVSGGGYFRLLPYWLTKKALKHINNKEQKNFIFYLHPWEVDPEQPRFKSASALSKFRHYLNLNKTEGRFTRLLNEFKFCPIHKNGYAKEAN